MISISKANAILNNLFGVENSTMNRPASVYLGLSETKPNNSGGNITEPTNTGCAYERKLVGGVDSKEVFFNASAANGGVISNTAEIKFNTAKAAYGKKMNYWFLASGRYDNAFLWGRLKDVRFEKKTRSCAATDEISTTTKFEADVESAELLNMASGTDYVVWWKNINDSNDKGKEYDVKSSEYVKGGKTYIHIGNPMFNGGEDDGTPFAVLYKQETVGAETTGHIEIYSKEISTSVEVAVYGLGIDVKKATVPTFYAGELQASVEVQTDN